MSLKLLSTRQILLLPLLFFIMMVINISYNYFDYKSNMYDFVHKQAQTLKSFKLIHRTYYQQLYLDKIIPLNKNSLKGLPAFASYDISKQFSEENIFNISVQTVSDRARNYKNQADESELKAIKFFNKDDTREEYFELEDDYYQYAAPLFISDKYDKAYDYELGELRGIISIKIPLRSVEDYFSRSLVKKIFFDFLVLLITLAAAGYLIKYFQKLSGRLEIEVEEKTRELESIANTDILTGFGSRYKLNNAIQGSKRPALAIINIDNFSQLNDFYGHETGDQIIVKLGTLIEVNILPQSNCKIFHLQGDEYVVFNDDISSEEFIERINKLIIRLSNTSLEVQGEKLQLTFSTSISFESNEKIFTTADMALKVAKITHQNIVIYNEQISLNEDYENNILWARKIKKAIDEDKVVPYFQAIVNNTNGKREKYECLVRLLDEGKVISPYYFLNISKQTKYYTQLTKIMITKSFDVFKDINAQFSINITVEDILNHEINSFLCDMLHKYNFGNRVILELVESESIENFPEISLFIEKVKSHGCKIAIDDFGTGYSNFEYLLKLKADYIKIDGSMIKNIDTDNDAKLVVSTIVDFAKKMNIKTIAEFVETEAIAKSVKDLGIDYSQGYYFSHPLPDIRND